MGVFESRLSLVTRQLARSPYLAGDAFTAADISVGYALQLARNFGGVALGEAEQAYLNRLRARAGYQRALRACPATQGAWAEAPGPGPVAALGEGARS